MPTGKPLDHQGDYHIYTALTLGNKGGYVIAVIETRVKIYTIENMYTLNNDNKSFFTELLQRLDSWGTTNLIFGGDMNTVWDSLMDRAEESTSEEEKRRNYGGVYVGIPADAVSAACSTSKDGQKGLCTSYGQRTEPAHQSQQVC
ncbi:hypothetical protein XELAEV_18017407mg [Xenopus laevis]|uniref:Endonuclease/exonuclease/phosphatase domain-containing protein n=1 Tax=Xenopus laevis TaxID=8355 RepID=A0A974DB44_XENLA|nr:hypothetical protein XELAEV_18017407mg [Xenopus laevis]